MTCSCYFRDIFGDIQTRQQQLMYSRYDQLKHGLKDKVIKKWRNLQKTLELNINPAMAYHEMPKI